MNPVEAPRNIGCVEYIKDFENGTMGATWNLDYDGTIIRGSGKAIGKSGISYEGEYRIHYFDERGADAGTYDPIIARSGNFFRLEWYQELTLKYYGTGMVSDGKLIAGWTKA